MQILPTKKIYFLSDFHLGAPDVTSSLLREKKIVQFLESIRHNAQAIFIVGDMFDFWYEYKTVVPKGYTRLFGKLAEITDSGIPIHFFVGNHDMWMNGYFETELNICVYHQPKIFQFSGKQFYIGHGDGLGPDDHGYKFIKKIFRNPICNWLFGQLHPNCGINLANYFSKKSREKAGNTDEHFLGEDKEWLIIYCKQLLQHQHYDFFIFGHRHLPLNFKLSATSSYINLGDWIRNFTYATFDGNNMQLHKWQD
ncbi:MAG: UDP-2,3-diacylglucosamine diphosphatase [Deinococcales bacterium]|nr:UDP-2,3-diacylglucosamine diphosphatase [Chitinophagaceae bacterium]